MHRRPTHYLGDGGGKIINISVPILHRYIDVTMETLSFFSF